ncbi:hypothetical protein V1506DRAFT_555240 [Lipomyces tetrasporus]
MSDRLHEEISLTASQPPRFDLERELLQRFINLHTSHPHHEIFGEPTKGLLRLPLYPSRPTDQNWANVCRRIALRVSDEMGSSFGPNECWLARSQHIQFKHGGKIIKGFQIFRLLCFLADPTPLNWEYLSNATLVKCRYLCNRQQEQNDGHIAYCLNGMYHGRFLTGLEDEPRSICTYTDSIALSTQPFAEISPSAPHSPRLQLERTLLQLFIDLHTSEPNHEIFGEPAPGLVRLPLYSSPGNHQSWAKVCRNLAVGVLNEMKSSFQLQACWMSRTTSTQISKSSMTSQRKTTIYKNVMIHVIHRSHTLAIEERKETMGK